MYPLNTFLSAQYSIVTYKPSVVQQISRTFPSCVNETLYPLNRNFPIFPPLRKKLFLMVKIQFTKEIGTRGKLPAPS